VRGEWSISTLKKRTNFSHLLKSGFQNGATAGCFSSLVFIVLVIIFFGISIGGFGGWIILAVYTATLYGFFPALIIACVFGLINGLVFYILQPHLTNKKRSLIVSIILSLVIALPAISIWWVFFFSGFEIEQMEFSGLIKWYFVPFCLATGLYVGNKLNQVILKSKNLEAGESVNQDGGEI
jgi:hypothetical protein